MILDVLPNGHFKVDEIVKLLEKHTAKKPVVDLDFLVDNMPLMNEARNYTVKIVQKDENGEWYSPAHVVAVIQNTRDLEVLKDAIRKTNKRIHGTTPEPEKKVRAITTAVDDLDGERAVNRRNTKSRAAYGKKMASGRLTVEKSEDVA